MGTGGSKAGRAGGGGGVNPNNIINTEDMISNRSAYVEGTNEAMNVARDLEKEFGEVLNGAYYTATFKGKDSNVLGAYDGSNIIINSKGMDVDTMNAVMESCAQSGWHPPLGNKSGIESVTAHEFGHALTDAVGSKLGGRGIGDAATYICNEARKITGQRGNIILGRSISEYATTNNRETVAEAVCDWYCNGNNAKAGSQAIVNVIKRELGV